MQKLRVVLFPGHKVRLVLRVFKDLKVFKVLPVLKVYKVKPGLQERMELQ
jgi:hypothetical protein